MDIVRLRDLPPWFARALVFGLIVLALAIILVPIAWSAPKANDGQECSLAADMAVTAAALAVEKVERKRAEPIMLRIYSLDPVRGIALMQAIVRVVYRDAPDPEKFATALFVECTTKRGNMDAILGTDS